MIRLPHHVWTTAFAAGLVAMSTAPCLAGPWGLFGRNQPAYPVGQPVPVSGQTAYSPAVGYVPPSYAPYAGSQLAGTSVAFPPPAYMGAQSVGYGSYAAVKPPSYDAPAFAPGFPQTVAAYLPTAAYDTQWNRVPVTYYRPVTAFDPRYGTTVTSLQPCTSYQYQAQRSPVIAPRPLLGDYGLQANKWPSITGPGYNPTGLMVSNMPPVAVPYQAVPTYGTPYLGQSAAGQPSYAPMASSGTSLGMPSTNLPATTMSSPTLAYAPPVAASVPAYAPVSGYATALPSNYYGSASYPSATSPYYASQPAANSFPNNCANGTCSTGIGSGAPMSVPNIPGAASVTPYGPPTYSPIPNNGAPAGMIPGAAPGYSGGTINPAPIMPPGQVLPNQGVMPGGAPNSNLVDPESARQPSFGSAFPPAAPSPSPSLSPADVRKQPMVAIDRGAPTNGSERSSTNPPLVDLKAKGASQPTSIDPSLALPSTSTASIPDTLPREYSSVKPLNAPQNFDSRPRWNPMLLDPEDRTAMEQDKVSPPPSPVREAVSRRIRLVELDLGNQAEVATHQAVPGDSQIQLASGVERRKPVTTPISQPIQPGFRPVTKLK